MSRVPRPDQYGSADLATMTHGEINQARKDGHLADLMSGNDPDATVQHSPDCTKPEVQRVYRINDGSKSVQLGDPVRYRCRTCGRTSN